MLTLRSCWTMICLLLISAFAHPQESMASGKTQVMTLGVFHFNFPNLDARKVEDKDKIDVLEEKYQRQIVKIADELKAFKPTTIVIEAQAAAQGKMDSLYGAYTRGTYALGRNETEQLGFRLAKELKLARVECVDTWGKFYENLGYLFDDTSARAKAFEQFYFHNPDSIYSKKRPEISLATDSGIIENLLYLNDPGRIKEDLGAYLIGHFKYEETEGDYTGADFETGRWFNRNLRIFRNIQRVTKSTSDRILVIFGAGHLNILNYLFECSPEYALVSPLPFLRNAKR